MMYLFGDPYVWLPVVFAILMGVSILQYVVLDGFDLGVGLLFPLASDAEKDKMISSIGPFWDANETWLVMAIGLLLVAFPVAHGVILTALYIPVFIMLIGLILRGVAFEFRAKVPPEWKGHWNWAFFIGSLSTALSQGYMLGIYVMGLETTPETILFAALTSVALVAGYALIGACWLVMKTEHGLQRKAVNWAKYSIWGAVIGMIAVSVASPAVSSRIFEKWFTFPEIILLAPLPLVSILSFAILWVALGQMPRRDHRWEWIPFAATTSLFILAFVGLGYSFYPYVVPEKLTIFEAAAAPESLIIILAGTVVLLPTITAYSMISYVVFKGKTSPLTYD